MRPVRPRHALPTLAVLGALAAAGCGAATDSSEEFEGPQQEVATVIEDLETAARDDEPRRVCQNLLAEDLASELGDGCRQAVQQAFDEADTIEIEVESIEIDGDTARALIDTGRDGDRRETVELVREDNGWRIAAFGGPS